MGDSYDNYSYIEIDSVSRTEDGKFEIHVTRHYPDSLVAYPMNPPNRPYQLARVRTKIQSATFVYADRKFVVCPEGYVCAD